VIYRFKGLWCYTCNHSFKNRTDSSFSLDWSCN